MRTAHPLEITDAVVAAAQAVFGASGKLVFGGHPTISPLILSVADDFSGVVPEKPFVKIYQSALFETQIAPQTRELAETGMGEIAWVDPLYGKDWEESVQLSLAPMRHQMLKETDPVAAIFIGGMEGIEDEFQLFLEQCPERPVYSIGRPGGAARKLARAVRDRKVDLLWEFKAVSTESLLESSIYPALMRRIIADMSERV